LTCSIRTVLAYNGESISGLIGLYVSIFGPFSQERNSAAAEPLSSASTLSSATVFVSRRSIVMHNIAFWL
jgi:hypothetical protein